jgi:hypothetical protein
MKRTTISDLRATATATLFAGKEKRARAFSGRQECSWPGTQRRDGKHRIFSQCLFRRRNRAWFLIKQAKTHVFIL